MHNIATVTTAPEYTALTTLDRVKLELDISSNEYDALLSAKILEASSDIESQLARILCRAGLTERFWGEPYCEEYLILRRWPVAAITTVTVDDVEVDEDEYRLDADTGELFRLDASGYPCVWTWCKDIVVVYTAGYVMPESQSPTLPASLEGAAIELVGSYWMSRGRDPKVRSEDIPGLGSVTYWVGSVGASGELPPSVMTKIAPYRRPAI
jgi:uncharacterized phiE125 gp8 family phage protein